MSFSITLRRCSRISTATCEVSGPILNVSGTDRLAIADAHIVTTNDGRPPTPATASPLRGVPGRGSIVFFNQVSMFQQGELGSSVKNARAAGQTTTCDNEPIIAGLPSY